MKPLRLREKPKCSTVSVLDKLRDHASSIAHTGLREIILRGLRSIVVRQYDGSMAAEGDVIVEACFYHMEASARYRCAEDPSFEMSWTEDDEFSMGSQSLRAGITDAVELVSNWTVMKEMRTKFGVDAMDVMGLLHVAAAVAGVDFDSLQDPRAAVLIAEGQMAGAAYELMQMWGFERQLMDCNGGKAQGVLLLNQDTPGVEFSEKAQAYWLFHRYYTNAVLTGILLHWKINSLRTTIVIN